jgi:hypothetical protein
MGVEARNKNGNLYYYRKRRVGDRVVSEYVGGGLVVDLAQRSAEIEQARKQAEREQLKAERMSMAEIDNALDDFSNMVDSLVEAELISLGFHRHKRQWRKRRNGKG